MLLCVFICLLQVAFTSASSAPEKRLSPNEAKTTVNALENEGVDASLVYPPHTDTGVKKTKRNRNQESEVAQEEREGTKKKMEQRRLATQFTSDGTERGRKRRELEEKEGARRYRKEILKNKTTRIFVKPAGKAYTDEASRRNKGDNTSSDLFTSVPPYQVERRRKESQLETKAVPTYNQFKNLNLGDSFKNLNQGSHNTALRQSFLSKDLINQGFPGTFNTEFIQDSFESTKSRQVQPFATIKTINLNKINPSPTAYLDPPPHNRLSTSQYIVYDVSPAPTTTTTTIRTGPPVVFNNRHTTITTTDRIGLQTRAGFKPPPQQPIITTSTTTARSGPPPTSGGLGSTKVGSSHRYVTVAPSQTISLPTLTAMLYADTLPETAPPTSQDTYARGGRHSDSADFRKSRASSTVTFASKAVTGRGYGPILVKQDEDSVVNAAIGNKDTPTTASSFSDILEASNNNRQIRARRNSRVISFTSATDGQEEHKNRRTFDTAADADYFGGRPKNRPVRHNSQNPYRYRDIHGSGRRTLANNNNNDNYYDDVDDVIISSGSRDSGRRQKNRNQQIYEKEEEGGQMHVCESNDYLI